MSTESRRGAQWRERYDPWALVTGASDGIGRAMANDLAARRLNVILVARRGDQLETLAANIINQSISSCTFLLTGRISSDSEGR